MDSAMRHPPNIRHMMMTTSTQPIPDRPSPGLQRAAPSAVYQGGGGKCATDIQNNKCYEQHHFGHMERKNTERNRQAR